jgi:hypothetical protein
MSMIEDTTVIKHDSLETMRSILGKMNNMGIKITWSSFRKFCNEEVEMGHDLLQKFGLDGVDSSKVAALFIPEVLEKKVAETVRIWAINKERENFSSDNNGSISEAYSKAIQSINDLAEKVRRANGHHDNVMYVKGVYKMSMHAFSACMPTRENFNMLAWIDSVKACHEAHRKFYPNIAVMFVSFMISIDHGTKYKNTLMEDRFKKEVMQDIIDTFEIANLGMSVIKDCEDVYKEINECYKKQYITQNEFVTMCVEECIQKMSNFCDTAFSDRFAHAMAMNKKFCRRFYSDFGIDISDHKLEIATKIRED